MPEPARAPRGATLRAKGWRQEAAMRMLLNNLDPDVAERPQDLVVYGGSGKAARDWPSLHAILRELERLENDETLLVQSGKPVGVFRTHEEAPRVLIANSNLVGRWSTWEVFRDLERAGLMMYGQMTAGSWIYIGSQGILQGTYETFAAAARKHFGGSLAGRFVLTGGMGGMGGAQPLAATLNGAAILCVEADPARIARRVAARYCDKAANSLDEALAWIEAARRDRRAVSIGLAANCADVLPELVRRGVTPDLVTDQTSAHDPLHGYIPRGLDVAGAAVLRAADPREYIERAMDSIALHVRAMLEMQRAGAIAFDYGNNIRRMAADRGVAEAFNIPGFVPEYIRPLFCEGRGPFRWVALSGEPADIHATDELVLRMFPDNESLTRWIRLARERVAFQGLPARICWLGYGERAAFALELNRMVARGALQAPIVIGRDHLDCGSVASPYRETEAMRDGSDAVADWPILNALLNTACGASWVSVHNGGGVGIGYSLHAGQVTVVDGSAGAARCAERVMTCDAGIGILRHADAGYAAAPRMRRPPRITQPHGRARRRMSKAILIRGVRQLLTLRGATGTRRGPLLGELGLVEDGAVLIRDGLIREVGPARRVENLSEARGAQELSAAGCVVMPGFVDCHTHLVFGPPRLEDFEQRLAGRSYEEIAAAGGGILRSVEAVRNWTSHRLAERANHFLRAMAAHGTTTVEAKSGYGLDEAAELKQLRILRALDGAPLDIVPTFLGAHATPPEFAGRPDAYIHWLCDELLPLVAARKLARFADVYCDRNAFTVAQAERYLTAAAALRLGLKAHASQFASLGAATLAARLGAVSVDHLENASAEEIRTVAASHSVAVLLPGSVYHLGLERHAPARALIEAGAAVALATDFNPGSSPTFSMQMALALACTALRMSPAEALTAATINAAHAIGMAARIGSLEPGKQADLVVLDCGDYREIPYFFGANHVLCTIKHGRVIYRRSEPVWPAD